MVRPQPDERGHWGPYGGRYVPETLMAPLEELASAYETARADESFRSQLETLLRDYSGRPTPLFHAVRLTEQAGGASYLSKARRPVAYRLPQNQQCAWSGTFGAAHGQASRDRGDRCRPAWGSSGDCLCAV